MSKARVQITLSNPDNHHAKVQMAGEEESLKYVNTQSKKRWFIRVTVGMTTLLTRE